MKIKIMKSLISIAILTAINTSASAAAIGTPAGTAIDNTASISYSVGGTGQTPIESSLGGNTTPGVGNGSATQFTVDKKIDLLVSKGSDVTVVPEEVNKNITFTVKNEGNSTEYFKLEQTNVANGGGAGQDDFNPVAASCSITLPATNPVQIASGDITSITVKCDIPVASATVANGKKSTIDLKATAITGNAMADPAYQETAGADTAINVAGSEDIVLADDIGSPTDIAVGNAGDRNATHSAVNNYNIVTADLEVTKASAVFSDPFNGLASGGNNPKRIPGAEVEYTITIKNTGSATATNLIMTDPLPANMTFVASSCSVSGGIAAATCNLSGSDVVSSSFSLAAAGTATLTFRATVN